MNQFHKISTENYEAISHEDRYLYKQYESIDSFIKINFDSSFSNILAKPIFKKKEVTWYTNYETNFKRISNFNEQEKEKILQNYWLKISQVQTKIKELEVSKKLDKRNWALILKDVFNDENNIVFSDGENIAILWGWQFRNKKENFIPVENRTPSLIKDPVISEPAFEEKSKVKPGPIPKFEPDPITDPEPEKEIQKKKPWWILLLNGIWWFIKKFWWIILLILLLLLFSDLFKKCSREKEDDLENKEEKTFIDKNNPEHQVNHWNIDDNNTGLKENEYKQIIENNNSPELYENLLTDENGDKRLIPNKPNVNIPIDPESLIKDEENYNYIVPDRVNVVLKNKNDDIESFAVDFKNEFPDEDYQIIYRDEQTRRVQIRIPESERENFKPTLKNKLKKYELLVWDETVFQNSNFNDPGFEENSKSWYFENINMKKAWEKTTGKSDVIIAVIDDGFDLNHDELKHNIVKPWNVLNQNKNVYASNTIDHGTHVAGLAIAQKNNGKGVSGIAPDCSFMPIQIGGNQPGFSMTSVIDGILYAINNGADVINLSIQQMYPEEAQQINQYDLDEILRNTTREDEYFWSEVFEMANDENVTIVFAAGNTSVLVGLDAMKRDNSIVTVSALDKMNKKAYFSNFGEKSTVSAPGVGIYSCKPGNRFVEMDGTSMSSPIVAGLVGLMKSVNPNLNNEKIIEILQNSGKQVDNKIGPLVQADKAIKMSKFGISDEELSDEDIQQKINELKRQIKELKKECPDCN